MEPVRKILTTSSRKLKHQHNSKNWSNNTDAQLGAVGKTSLFTLASRLRLWESRREGIRF